MVSPYLFFYMYLPFPVSYSILSFHLSSSLLVSLSLSISLNSCPSLFLTQKVLSFQPSTSFRRFSVIFVVCLHFCKSSSIVLFELVLFYGFLVSISFIAAHGTKEQPRKRTELMDMEQHHIVKLKRKPKGPWPLTNVSVSTGE